MTQTPDDVTRIQEANAEIARLQREVRRVNIKRKRAYAIHFLDVARRYVLWLEEHDRDDDYTEFKMFYGEREGEMTGILWQNVVRMLSLIDALEEVLK